MHQDADNAYGEASAEQGEKKASGDLINSQPDVPAEHIVGTVRDIYDVHHPENEGKPTCQKKEDGCKGNTAKGLNNKKIHDLSPFRLQNLAQNDCIM